ncbi:MAG: c-type cytochrome, partial [Rhizobiales bacterium]|nr:c-type cytochrome [Rhizobacter sp.]
VLATGGNLVFQGQMDDRFNAYDARTGKRLWSYDAKAPVIAPPISYRVGGRQYVTVLTGNGTSGGFLGTALARYGIDYRTQARRVLTFVLDGTATLPDKARYVAEAVEDPTFKPDKVAEAHGGDIYNSRCVVCHGGGVAAAGVAPDLRTSATVVTPGVFDEIVHGGMLVSQGMPQFGELTPKDRADLRQFLRAAANDLREQGKRAG